MTQAIGSFLIQWPPNNSERQTTLPTIRSQCFRNTRAPKQKKEGSGAASERVKLSEPFASPVPTREC
jgi:hypothetical protein